MAPLAHKQSPPSKSTVCGWNPSRHQLATHNEDRGPFRTTKQDKQRVKHSTFVSRIEKPHIKNSKKRRSSRKLLTSLESLASALPDASPIGAASSTKNKGMITHKSLKSKPGALKKKARIEELERDRFSKNLAQMTDGQSPAPEGSSTAPRWAALRVSIRFPLDKRIS